MDEMQAGIVASLLENPRMFVSGGAGTGKSLVAREAAKRLADGGVQRVALLCFTAPLAKWLRDSTEASVHTVSTIRHLAHEIMAASGQSLPPLANESDWEALGLAAAELLEKEPGRFDAVAIDEAQDFSASDWLLVDQLAKSAHHRWAFGDEQQAFWQARKIDEGQFMTRYKLLKNYRNPPGIAAYAEQIAGRACDEEAVRAAFADGTIATVMAPSANAVVKRVETEIDKLLGQGLALGDIAVLSVRGVANANALVKGEWVGRHRVVRADADDAPECVVADTFLRFKGLERPGVIVVDAERVKPEERGMRMHVAVTRATLVLRVVGAEGGAAS